MPEPRDVPARSRLADALRSAADAVKLRRRSGGSSTSASWWSGTRATSRRATARAAGRPAGHHRDGGPGQVAPRCSSTARSAPARGAHRSTWPSIGYTDVLNIQGRPGRVEGARRRVGGARPAPHRGASSAATRASSSFPEIGQEGQRKLLDSRVLLIGAGGLGSPAGAVPGGLGDRHASASWTTTWSTSRTSSARSSTPPIGSGCPRPRARSSRSTPSTPSHASSSHPSPPGRENVDELVAGYDVIVDGTDNFETRYLLNDASVALPQAGGPRLHLPLGRPGHDLRPVRRARATAACTRPSRRTSWRRPARWRACWACCRGSSACSRPTRPFKLRARRGGDAGRPDAAVRRHEHLVRRDPHLARPGLPGLRRRGRRLAEPARPDAGRPSPVVSQVRIPPVLRETVGGQREVEAAGGTRDRGPGRPLRRAIPPFASGSPRPGRCRRS